MTDPAPRHRLSAERIVAEAFALVDGEGTDAFSFRVLAARLGCQAMSLYHYFPSKAHLFEAMVGVCIGELTLPPPGEGWRQKASHFCYDFRAMALRHPGFFGYFTIFRLNNAAGLRFLQELLSVFEETGLPADRRAFHFRAIGYYIGGAGLDEALGYAKGPSSVDPVPEDVARRDYPAITAVGPWFAQQHHEAIFMHGLTALLDAIERDIAAQASG
jgi:AcrR family transcriptional regulator